jgi:anti-anti-sigma factor
VLQTSVQAPEPAMALRPPQFPHRLRSLDADVKHAVRVTVAGELDVATAPKLDRALRRAHGRATLVILDLRELEFTDSSGAHLILAADRRIRRAGGRLVVVRGGAEVEWLFALIGLDRELELVDQPPAPARAPVELGDVPV